MSAKAKQLIKQAIQTIKDEDGASDIGCYRDVVTEVLHLARKKFKKGPYSNKDYLLQEICSSGFLAFDEELELLELQKLNRIPKKNLPLHTIDEFTFESIQKEFEKRLKGN